MTPNDKLNHLKNIIKECNSVIIAFSGGVDSTFLAKVTSEVLGGESILLVTASSSTYPFYELQEAKKLAELLRLPHEVIISEETKIPGFKNNPPDRCYYCKDELFSLIRAISAQRGYCFVFDGSNFDDLTDYRPGRKALEEHNIKSPLVEAKLTKKDIRYLSEKLNLPTYNKGSYACLASRFPYGEEITLHKLDRVGKAELGFKNIGFQQFRIRSHDNLARIELSKKDFEKAWGMRDQLIKICKSAGFLYISIDLEGYRSGSMNEQ